MSVILIQVGPSGEPGRDEGRGRGRLERARAVHSWEGVGRMAPGVGRMAPDPYKGGSRAGRRERAH